MKICPALIGKAVAKVHQINEKSINWLYGNLYNAHQNHLS
jgi:hypothetical protein